MKKVGINEDDSYILFQRYDPSTIQTLFDEVYEVADVKIDWNALVKKTTTGITNAREYQMLWSHLAYHHRLLDKIEEGAEPLDDESDFELELVVAPPLIEEAYYDAAKCVQHFSSCASSRGLGSMKKTCLKTPLAEKRVDKEMLDTTPDERPPQTSHGVAASTLQKNQTQQTGSSYPPRKKRKLWTKEEDKELIDAVHKFGEGNWVNILRANLKLDCTPSQLSKRWSTIRKRDANILAVSGDKLARSAQSEERIAAQKAISLALDTPKGGRLSVPEALAVSSQSFNGLKPHTPAASQALDSRFSYKRGTTSTKSTTHFASNSSIQAAAFAAGGRIATPSTVASFFRASQSKNAVHIGPSSSTVPSSSNLIKQFAATSAAATTSKSMSTVATTAPPLANPVSSSCNTKPGGQQVQDCSAEVVKNSQNAGSDTIQHDLLGQELEWENDGELCKLLEFCMDSAIENDVGNANDASDSANSISSSYNAKPREQQVQLYSVEVVKNSQNAESDTIQLDLLGQDLECANESELYKALEFDMDSVIENGVDNANDASESASIKKHAPKELLTKHADSKVISSVSETENMKSGQ